MSTSKLWITGPRHQRCFLSRRWLTVLSSRALYSRLLGTRGRGTRPLSGARLGLAARDEERRPEETGAVIACSFAPSWAPLSLSLSWVELLSKEQASEPVLFLKDKGPKQQK